MKIENNYIMEKCINVSVNNYIFLKCYYFHYISRKCPFYHPRCTSKLAEQITNFLTNFFGYNCELTLRYRCFHYQHKSVKQKLLCHKAKHDELLPENHDNLNVCEVIVTDQQAKLDYQRLIHLRNWMEIRTKRSVSIDTMMLLPN